MLQAVIERLTSLGTPISSEPSSYDTVMLQFSLDKVTSHILSKIKIKAIPDGLYHVAVDMVTADYLSTKKAMGLLSLSTIDFGLFAKQIQEGDISITYDEKGTPEQQFNAFVNALQHKETDFKKFRVLSW